MKTPDQLEVELLAIVKPIAKFQRHATYAIRILFATYLLVGIFPLAPYPIPHLVMTAWGLASVYSVFVVFFLIQAISSTPLACAISLAAAFPLFTLPILVSVNRMAIADILAADLEIGGVVRR